MDTFLKAMSPGRPFPPACITKFGFQFRASHVIIDAVSFNGILKSHTAPITNDYLSNFMLLTVRERCWASAGKALDKPHQIKYSDIFDTMKIEHYEDGKILRFFFHPSWKN